MIAVKNIHQDFIDVKVFTMARKVILNLLTSGQKAEWLKIRSMKLTGSSNLIEIKYCHNSEVLTMDLNHKKRTRSGGSDASAENNHDTLTRYYSTRLCLLKQKNMT